MTVRVKRGLTDTAMSGGLYKDKVYLEGAVRVLQQRRMLDFKLLHSAKISFDDLKRSQVQDIIVSEGLIMPPFLYDMDDYMRCLEKIKETNYIDDNGSKPTCELPEAAVNTSMYYTKEEYEALKVEIMEKAKAAQTDSPDEGDYPGEPRG